jgi:hypothetical protein
MFDGKAFGKDIVVTVKGYVDKTIAPLLARIDALEQQIKDMPAPLDLSGDLAALKSAVEAIVIPDLPDLPEIELPDIQAMVEEAVKSIPSPQDGKSVTVEDVAPLIAAEVEKRVSELPAAKDGKDGVDGKDGLDVSDLFRAEGGKLIAVMSDGRTKDLGVFVGKDGEPGKPGRDGFSLKHFDADLMADGRTILLKFEDGSDQSYSVEIGVPTMIYRGVFKEGEQYEKGDTVTWGGSIWHCDEPTTEKPEASKAWRLAVKRGRDGKDGKPGEKGDPGPKGKDGKDLTQLGPDGSKW